MLVSSTLRRGFTHLRNGTLFERLEHRLQEARARRRGHRDATIAPGTKLRLYYDSEVAKWIESGTFEPNERQFIQRYLQPGDVFVDVGANIGFFTLIASSIVGPTGRVIAFEPCSKTFHRLQENARLNAAENIVVERAALSDREEARDLITSLDGFDAWNSLGRPFEGKDLRPESVRCTTWDSYQASSNLQRATLIKIDVEGWELRVLQGAADSLRGEDAPDLLVEFADATSELAGSSCRQLYDFIRSFGYMLFNYDATKNEIIPEVLQSTYVYVNLIATKRPVALRSRLQK